MSTNIEIEDMLLAKVVAAAGDTTEKAAVTEALEYFVRAKGQAEFRKLRGQIQWIGDLDESRKSRTFEPS
jgi:Arc/MetJ family transcription regulator